MPNLRSLLGSILISVTFGTYFKILSGLNNGKSLFRCGQKLNFEQNSRLCSRFYVEEHPRDELTEILKKSMNETSVHVNDTFLYCRCKGHACNKYASKGLKCFSSPSVDEETQPLYQMEKLYEKNTFSEDNLVSCPQGITQCYSYSEFHTKNPSTDNFH